MLKVAGSGGLCHVRSLTPPPPSILPHPDLNPAFRGPLSGAHTQRDDAERACYGYTLDVTARGRGRYRLFAVPDAQPAGRLLAAIEADPAFVHRWAGAGMASRRAWRRCGNMAWQCHARLQPSPAAHAAHAPTSDLLSGRARDHPLLSFAMTQNYLVLAVWPLLLSPLKLALHRAPLPAMAWRPEKGTMFYVVDRRSGGHVATYRWGGCLHELGMHTTRLPGLPMLGDVVPPCGDSRGGQASRQPSRRRRRLPPTPASQPSPPPHPPASANAHRQERGLLRLPPRQRL